MDKSKSIEKIKNIIESDFKCSEDRKTESIEKICLALNCGVDDILEFIPEKEGSENA